MFKLWLLLKYADVKIQVCEYARPYDKESDRMRKLRGETRRIYAAHAARYEHVNDDEWLSSTRPSDRKNKV